MSDILKKHPEIETFAEDQLKVSESVKTYIEKFTKEHRNVFEKLKEFRKFYSETEDIGIDEIDELYSITGWTHTMTQQMSAVDFLNNVSDRYPVPAGIKGVVQEGELLDISQITDKEGYHSKLDEFAKKILKKELPKPIPFNLNRIGRLPISLIHSSDSTDYVDPLLVDEVNKIWTLDVSINPGLSIKDLIALEMVNDAVEKGEISQETVLVEGTSGNTGVGLAIVAAARGNRIILIIPDKMSDEKIQRLRLCGANVVVTPTKVDADDFKSYYTVTDYLTEATKGWKANQYHNLANRTAHEKITGPNIWKQTRGEVSVVIATAGTCGTVSGIGRYLKKQNPDIKIIAVDTIGSILYLLKEGYTIEEVQKYAKGYKIQGFGEDIYPKNLDLDVIDKFIRIGDKTGFEITQLLPALGYVSGQSSGAAYAALIEAVYEDYITPEDNVLVVFPDIGFPYRRDVYNDNWVNDLSNS